MSEMEMRSIKIPKDLYRKLKKRIRDTEFTSVSEYAGYILSEVLENLDEDVKDEKISEADEEKVKERLKALGYLD